MWRHVVRQAKGRTYFGRQPPARAPTAAAWAVACHSLPLGSRSAFGGAVGSAVGRGGGIPGASHRSGQGRVGGFPRWCATGVAVLPAGAVLASGAGAGAGAGAGGASAGTLLGYWAAWSARRVAMYMTGVGGVVYQLADVVWPDVRPPSALLVVGRRDGAGLPVGGGRDGMKEQWARQVGHRWYGVHLARARLALRGLFLLVVFGPLALSGWLLFGPPGRILSDGRRSGWEVRWYALARWTLERGGAAFIKWGQWASMRADLFPQALCGELAALHASAPAHSFAETERQVLHDFGASIGELFSYFEETPVASGSIAQIHRAVPLPNLRRTVADRNGLTLDDGDLRDAGEEFARVEVAVKVRHPGVERQMTLDFQLMRMLAGACKRFGLFKRFQLDQSLESFSDTMTGQVNLDVEAANLDRFIWNFRKWRAVSFPRPMVASHGVIVETLENGLSIADHIAGQEGTLLSSAVLAADGAAAMKALGGSTLRISPSSLAQHVVAEGQRIYTQMLLVDNFMHADLHPGNILLRSRASGDTAAGGPSPEPQFVLVDAGMVAELSSYEREAFVGFFNAMGAGDGAEAGRSVLAFGNGNAGMAASERAGFVDAMSALFSDKCKGYGTNVNLGDVLRETLTLVRVHHVGIDANFATLVINALCIEGLAQQLTPEACLLDEVGPMLRAHKWLGPEFLSQVNPLITRFRNMQDVFQYKGALGVVSESLPTFVY